MMYRMSSEEAKYLAGLRKEKESFEKLIKERGVSDIGVHNLKLLTCGTEVNAHANHGRP